MRWLLLFKGDAARQLRIGGRCPRLFELPVEAAFCVLEVAAHQSPCGDGRRSHFFAL